MAFSVGGSNGGGGGGRFGRRFRGGSSALSEINIVPLVDVVLVLLIIFMLTAHVMEFGLEIDVPQVKHVRDTAEDLPVVSITKDAKIYLNGASVNINEIATQLHRKFKNATKVYVQADAQTVFDTVAQVIAELGDAKFQVQVVTKPMEGNPRKR
jgi:biopolymer transport protein ExbD